MIKFELLSLKCNGLEFNWKSKNITIRHNIEYLIINLEHYKINENTLELSNEELKIPFTNSDILKYWIKNINIYSKLFNIDFNNLKMDTDYSLAPLYVSRTKLKDFIIIGIFLLDYNNSNTNTNINLNNANKYTLLSTIKSLPSSKLCNVNKYNIISGILNYQKQKDNLDKLDKDDLKIEKNYLLIDNIKIPLKYILSNACNYLPKLDIIRISNKSLQSCFKVG